MKILKFKQPQCETVVDVLFAYGNNKIKFNERKMFVDYVDSHKDLTEWEKKTKDYATYMVLLSNKRGKVETKFAMCVREYEDYQDKEERS